MFKKIAHYLTPSNWKNDILSGVTVSLALVPEAIAFAFIAGVSPIIGLYAAFIVSFVAALLSGRPGMISGATGALAVVMVALVIEGNEKGEVMGIEGLGVEYLFATVILMGIIQLLAGAFKLGKFSRIIPHPVMLGFVNGLAIVIGLSQIPLLQTSTPDGKWGWTEGSWLAFPEMIIMLGLIGVTMAITFFLPKFTKIIPSALAGIIAVSAVVIFGGLDTPTVQTMLNGNSMDQGFPGFSVPEVPFFSLDTLLFILPYAIILAFIGLVESLMTLSLIDKMTNTRGKTNKECAAQGTANVITGFFGGMGGCAMVGQSMININSGGRGRLAGIIAGIGLLMIILFASPLIEKIPLAALVGVMFMVVIGTFAWSSFRIIHKIPRSDAFVLIVVSCTTVIFDLAVAVISGIIISALVFSWKKSKNIRVNERTDENGAKHYSLSGYIFFASAKNFLDLFANNIESDPKEVFIDFKNAQVLDHSGIDALNTLTDQYKKAGKIVHLQYLSQDCKKLLKDAEGIVEINISKDPKYRVATNKLDG